MYNNKTGTAHKTGFIRAIQINSSPTKKTYQNTNVARRATKRLALQSPQEAVSPTLSPLGMGVGRLSQPLRYLRRRLTSACYTDVLCFSPQGLEHKRLSATGFLMPVGRQRWRCTALPSAGTRVKSHPQGRTHVDDSATDKNGKKMDNTRLQEVNPSGIDVSRPVFPFTAIVGQEEMKLALILNVIDPKIGGVMIMGDRGTGKSTTVRALVDLLPEIEVVLEDPFNSDPYDFELMSQEVREKKQKREHIATYKRKISMVDLPLGATEDRVCGTIDIEKALTEGVKAFEAGLLAKANRGILYVDEVNLLDDHLVDVLLDSAASGWNSVEREGISISHPARFILVGSGNPEEGELRPQLLDRFGMHAQIGTVKDPHLRVQIVEQRAQFDESPTQLREQYLESQEDLAHRINKARELRPQVEMSYDLRVLVSQVCSELNVDGLRGDIVSNRASQAIAAFEERTEVTPEDIYRVIPLCLRHRLRKDPLESIDSGDKVRDCFSRVFGFERKSNPIN